MSANTPLIFIAGPSRSGTSLLCNVLGKNSKILGLNELHFFGDLCVAEDIERPVSTQAATMIMAKLRARHLRGLWDDNVCLEDEEFATRILTGTSQSTTVVGVFRRFAEAIATETGKHLVAEQTPRNILYAPRLLTSFPESKVIAMIRDPRAVLNSQRSRWQMRFLGAPNVPFTEAVRVHLNYHAVTMSKLWLTAVGVAESLQNHPRVRVVKYEDLVSAPRETLLPLCEFLGVPYEEAMLNVGQIGSSTQRNDGHNAGISTNSRDAWESQLPKGDRLICEHFTYSTARRHGYEIDEGRLLSFPSLFHLARFPLHLVGMLLVNPKRMWVMAKAVLRS